MLKTHVVRELKRLKMWKLFFKGWLFPRHVARSVALELGLAAEVSACELGTAWETALGLMSSVGTLLVLSSYDVRLYFL